MTADQLKDLAAWLESEIPYAMEGKMPPDAYNHAHHSLRADKFREVLRVVKAVEKLESIVGPNWVVHPTGLDGLICKRRLPIFPTAIEAIEASIQPATSGEAKP